MKHPYFTGATGASHHATQREISAQAFDLYDNWTDDYDGKLLGECGYRTPARVARVFHELVNVLHTGLPWWDLGAGSGLLGQALAQADIQLPLLAVDFSRTMLRKIDCENYVGCLEADVLAMPDDNSRWLRSVGGAFALGLSEHIADLNPLMRGCAALLSSDAFFIFSYCPSVTSECEVFEPFSGLRAHSEQHVCKALAAHGFALRSQHDGPGYQTAGQEVVHRIVVAQRL